MPSRALFVAASLASLFVGVSRPARAADLFGRVTESEVFEQKLSGKLQKLSFPSPALGGNRSLFVYTPPGYDPKSGAYPVIVLLHGSPGGQLDWAGKGHATETLDRAIVAGKFPASILVYPDGHGPFYKGGSEWADDISGRCKMDTAISRDLPKFLRSRFRVAENASQWTIGGLSEGAYGAANLAVRHPDVFQNVLAFSGEFAVSDDWPDTNDVFGPPGPFRAANSPVEAIRKLEPAARKRLRFYLAVGADDDEDLQTQAVSFSVQVRSLGAESRVVVDKGKHDWRFWNAQFSASLDYLAKWLAQPR